LTSKRHELLNLTLDKWHFLEVWVDVTASPPYILMLLGDASQQYYIIDPAEAYQVIWQTTSYPEAKAWLLEDEYERLTGQLMLDNQDLRLSHAPFIESNNPLVVAS